MRDAHHFLEGGEMVISFIQRVTGDDAPYSLEGGMLILPVKAGGDVLLHTEKRKGDDVLHKEKDAYL